jgi:hypothetical protein
MPTPSRSQQSILIDAVFHSREKHLLEAFRERLDQLERRQQLAHVSGIRDEAVLDRLLGLAITAESLAALGLVPLVWVARASGGVLGFGERVSPAEQAVLAQLAQAFD